MPDLSAKKSDADASILVDEALRMGQQWMSAKMRLWAEAYEAYHARGPIHSTSGINIKVNSLKPVVDTILPRDAQGLWPQRPYIPLRARNRDYAQKARYKERVIDAQNTRARFFPHAVETLKMALIYGTAYTKWWWDVWYENAFDRVIETDPVTGQIIALREAKSQIQKDGLALQAKPPWSLIVHPGGQTLTEKQWVIEKDVIPFSEAERMIDLSLWKMPKGKKAKDLLKGPTGSGFDVWETQWQRDLASFGSDLREEMVIVHSLYSGQGKDGRWITSLNYMLTVQDSESRMDNMDPRVKPFAKMAINPHIGSNRFFGEGLWDDIRDMSNLKDAMLSLYADAVIMQRTRWFLYDETHVDPESLNATFGGKIRVKNPSELGSEGFDRALRVLDVPPIDGGLLELVGIGSETIAERTGRNQIAAGNAPTPRQTARGTEILSEATASRIGFGSRYVEQTYMYEIADGICKTAARNMGLVQLMDDGGLSYDEAVEMLSADPYDIPGGFDYEFDGADQVLRRNEKHQKLIEGYDKIGNDPLIAGNPAAKMLFIRELARDMERFDEFEIDVITGVTQGAEQPMMPMGAPGDVSSISSTPGPVATPAVNAGAKRELMAA